MYREGKVVLTDTGTERGSQRNVRVDRPSDGKAAPRTSVNVRGAQEARRGAKETKGTELRASQGAERQPGGDRGGGKGGPPKPPKIPPAEPREPGDDDEGKKQQAKTAAAASSDADGTEESTEKPLNPNAPPELRTYAYPRRSPPQITSPWAFQAARKASEAAQYASPSAKPVKRPSGRGEIDLFSTAEKERMRLGLGPTVRPGEVETPPSAPSGPARKGETEKRSTSDSGAPSTTRTDRRRTGATGSESGKRTGGKAERKTSFSKRAKQTRKALSALRRREAAIAAAREKDETPRVPSLRLLAEQAGVSPAFMREVSRKAGITMPPDVILITREKPETQMDRVRTFFDQLQESEEVLPGVAEIARLTSAKTDYVHREARARGIVIAGKERKSEKAASVDSALTPLRDVQVRAQQVGVQLKLPVASELSRRLHADPKTVAREAKRMGAALMASEAQASRDKIEAELVRLESERRASGGTVLPSKVSLLLRLGVSRRTFDTVYDDIRGRGAVTAELAPSENENDARLRRASQIIKATTEAGIPLYIPTIEEFSQLYSTRSLRTANIVQDEGVPIRHDDTNRQLGRREKSSMRHQIEIAGEILQVLRPLRQAQLADPTIPIPSLTNLELYYGIDRRHLIEYADAIGLIIQSREVTASYVGEASKTDLVRERLRAIQRVQSARARGEDVAVLPIPTIEELAEESGLSPVTIRNTADRIGFHFPNAKDITINPVAARIREMLEPIRIAFAQDELYTGPSYSALARMLTEELGVTVRASDVSRQAISMGIRRQNS